MSGFPPSRSAAPRDSVSVTCSACGAATTVPFQPTPGRPVYCRDCFAKQRAAQEAAGGARPGGFGGPSAGGRGPGGPGGQRFRPRENDINATAPRKQMLAQGRKAHFVHDALEVLDRSGKMAEEQRRAFVEMLFSRGSRQSSDAAYNFLQEKYDDKTLTETEAEGLDRLIQKYSFRR